MSLTKAFILLDFSDRYLKAPIDLRSLRYMSLTKAFRSIKVHVAEIK